MKINLKKAAAIAAALSAVKIDLNHVYSVDIFADPPTEDTVKQLRDTLSTQVATYLALIETVFEIRYLIGSANEGRINLLLTQRALIEKQLSVVNSIPVRSAGTNISALQRQLEAFHNKEKASYVGIKLPTLELETASLVGPALSELKRRKRELDDELQALNFNTTIELPEDAVKVLTSLDLI